MSVLYTDVDAIDIFCGDHDDFDCAPEVEFDHGNTRSHKSVTRVFRNKAIGEYWAVSGRVGLTWKDDSEFDDAPFRVASRVVEAPIKRLAWFVIGTDVEVSA